MTVIGVMLAVLALLLVRGMTSRVAVAASARLLARVQEVFAAVSGAGATSAP